MPKLVVLNKWGKVVAFIGKEHIHTPFSKVKVPPLDMLQYLDKHFPSNKVEKWSNHVGPSTQFHTHCLMCGALATLRVGDSDEVSPAYVMIVCSNDKCDNIDKITEFDDDDNL